MSNIEATAYKATADTRAYVTIGMSAIGNPMIKKIRNESIFKDTDLKVGMVIVSINGASMEGKTAKDATGTIINASGNVTIVAKFCSHNKEDNIAVIMNELVEHPKLGIIRLDYDYPASPGDIDHPGSFGYPVVYRVVPGLTFQMAQSGDLTEEVAKEFENAIRYLADEKKCCAITGDCGFMFWFGKRAHAFTTVPVMLSALIQLPTITSVLLKESDKVLIVTANVKSLEPMKPLLNEVSGLLDHQEHYIYVGCEDVPHFGEEVENGLQVDTAKAEPGILKKIKDTLAKYPGIKAILLECTELPPYSDSLREQTGLPVYDAITCCDAIMSSFMDNARFGQDSWYKEWNGLQDEYTFGQELTEEDRAKLVSKPVDEHTMVSKPVCEHTMHMMMTELESTQLFESISRTGMKITPEEAAHAIAHQIEMNGVRDHMKEMEDELKSEGMQKPKTVRQLFARLRVKKG